MKRKWIKAEYTTELVADMKEGSTTLQLHRTEDGVATMVAKVVFWDATGQFCLSVSADELPLEIVEELILEARARIKIR